MAETAAALATEVAPPKAARLLAGLAGIAKDELGVPQRHQRLFAKNRLRALAGGLS